RAGQEGAGQEGAEVAEGARAQGCVRALQAILEAFLEVARGDSGRGRRVRVTSRTSDPSGACRPPTGTSSCISAHRRVASRGARSPDAAETPWTARSALRQCEPWSVTPE